MTIIIKSWLVKLVMLWIQLVNSGNFTKRSKPIWFILLYLEDALQNVKDWHDLQKHNTHLHKHYVFCKAGWIFFPVILNGYPLSWNFLYLLYKKSQLILCSVKPIVWGFTKIQEFSTLTSRSLISNNPVIGFYPTLRTLHEMKYIPSLFCR
jgi:hypothetical protein